MMCIDSNGNIAPRSITAHTADHGQTTTTDNSGAPVPPCEVSPIDQLRYEWLIFISALGVAAVMQTFGTLYAAMLPLQHGDEGPVDLETLTYEERAMVVATLWLVSIQSSSKCLAILCGAYSYGCISRRAPATTCILVSHDKPCTRNTFRCARERLVRMQGCFLYKYHYYSVGVSVCLQSPSRIK